MPFCNIFDLNFDLTCYSIRVRQPHSGLTMQFQPGSFFPFYGPIRSYTNGIQSVLRHPPFNALLVRWQSAVRPVRRLRPRQDQLDRSRKHPRLLTHVDQAISDGLVKDSVSGKVKTVTKLSLGFMTWGLA